MSGKLEDLVNYIKELHEDEKDNVYLGMSDKSYEAHLEKLIMLEDILDRVGEKYNKEEIK